MVRLIDAVEGVPFEVSLEGRTGGGYVWSAPELPPSFSALHRNVTPAAAVGGHGVEVLGFVASKAGRYRLRLVLKRPWEKTVLDEAEIEVTITLP